MFDWGSGVCLWSADDATISKFGDYPITTDNLPVSETTKNTLEHLISWHDEAFNWNNPSGELLWDEQQVKVFLN